MASGWRPILSGELAERARQAVSDIARTIVAAEPEDASLVHGAAGYALFLSYYAGAFDDERAAGRAGELLEWAGRQLAEQPMASGLYAGFTGVAWTVEHIAGATPGDPDDPNQEIDEALAELVGQRPWTGDYDLVGGLVGIGIYALERLPRPAAAAILERVLDQLESLAERGEPGLASWETPRALMSPAQRELNPDHARNLGVAHGIPGVLGLLARLAARGVAPERARALFEAGAAWLWAQRLPDRGGRRFASMQIETVPTRLAWCYGDLGIAAALLAAARAIESPRWESEALALALAAARPSEDSGVGDACLCHGALGNGHLFNRLFQATGDERFRHVALESIERGLSMRRAEAAAAGFLAWDPVAHAFAPSLDFLVGATGIGLVLLAALSGDVPAWDRTLLVDIPGP